MKSQRVLWVSEFGAKALQTHLDTLVETTMLPSGGIVSSIRSLSVTVKDGKCQEDAVWGVVYTIANTTTSNRVYKVETLTIEEEGFVEIAASYEPVFDGLNMQTLSWNDGYFVIEES